MSCYNKYYQHYTPAQLVATIENIAERYKAVVRMYQWALDHPNRYTVDDATRLYTIKEALWQQMMAIIPGFVHDEITTQVTEALAVSAIPEKKSLFTKIRQAIWRLLRR